MMLLASSSRVQSVLLGPSRGGALLVLGLVAMIVGSCGSDSGTEPAENRVPSLSGMTPASVTEGSGGFTLTVDGTDFVQASTVRWNGASQTTTFVSSSRLTASIAAADVAAEGQAQVTVSSPAPGGGVSSALTFQITAAPVASVAVVPDQETLLPEEMLALTATPRSADGSPLERSIAWASGDESVATVTGSGHVLAVAPGSTTITATSEGQSGQAEITVLPGVGPSGGTVAAEDGRATLQFPAGAVDAATAITIEVNDSPPAHTDLILQTAWDLGPDGSTFAQPVTVRLRYDPDELPGGADPEDLGVHRWDGAAWVALANGSVDGGAEEVSGTTTTFGTFAILYLPPGPVGFRSTGNGGGHACGVLTDGTGFCWGTNDDGQLGNDSTNDSYPPVPVSGGKAFEYISPGYDHTCGLTPGGDIYCWGAGKLGQIGNGLFGMQPTPTLVTGGHEFSLVSAGYDHVCGLDMDGAALCWGIGEDGTQGNGSTADQNAPGPVSGGHRFVTLTSGGYHTCGLAEEGEVWCWGWGFDGQLGTGHFDDATTPVSVTGGHAFTAISGGGYHTCGLVGDGDAYCWGWGAWGQIGSNVNKSASPRAVSGGMKFQSIIGGGIHTCALTFAGEAYCWGNGEAGMLGTGTPSQPNTPLPQAVAGGHTFVSLSAGDWQTCGVTTEAEAYCWGWRSDGTGNDAYEPVPVVVSASGVPVLPTGVSSGPSPGGDTRSRAHRDLRPNP